jgi:hypothetical protein
MLLKKKAVQSCVLITSFAFEIADFSEYMVMVCYLSLLVSVVPVM